MGPFAPVLVIKVTGNCIHILKHKLLNLLYKDKSTKNVQYPVETASPWTGGIQDQAMTGMLKLISHISSNAPGNLENKRNCLFLILLSASQTKKPRIYYHTLKKCAFANLC